MVGLSWPEMVVVADVRSRALMVSMMARVSYAETLTDFDGWWLLLSMIIDDYGCLHLRCS
ncbi:hypothetical protein Hanom_Chr03g00258191 [Helianthus anomalus]